MITHKQYMADSSALHNAYYLEIAQDAKITIPEHIMSEVRKSIDPHLNDVALTKWDALALSRQRALTAPLRSRGTFFSLASGVCACKAMARHLREQSQ